LIKGSGLVGLDDERRPLIGPGLEREVVDQTTLALKGLAALFTTVYSNQFTYIHSIAVDLVCQVFASPP
jgi:hypothetical protein